MPQVVNLVTVNTRRSKRKVVEWICQRFVNCLFLDLPTSWQSNIDDILRGISTRHVIEVMKDLGLVREPEDTQFLNSYDPILQNLHYINTVESRSTVTRKIYAMIPPAI